MGRPTKRTEEVERAILSSLERGNTRKASAGAAGVGYSTFREWELGFPEFAESVEKAEAVAQHTLLARIERASVDGQWQAAAWMLERRWFGDYGRKQAVEMTGKDGGPIDTRDLSTLADHERAALGAAIRRELALRAGQEPAPGSGAEPELSAVGEQPV